MADNKEMFLDDKAISLEDTEDSSKTDLDSASIIPFIMEKYSRAEDHRLQDETRWLRAYRNYRGLYGSDVQFTDAEKSRVFIKVTKTKVLAAYSQIVDVLFGNNKFPISIDPSELPDGVVDSVSFDPATPEQLASSDLDNFISPYGYKGDGKTIPAGATAKTLKESMGAEVSKRLEGITNVKEGPGLTPSSVTFEPAMLAEKDAKENHGSAR